MHACISDQLLVNAFGMKNGVTFKETVQKDLVHAWLPYSLLRQYNNIFVNSCCSLVSNIYRSVQSYFDWSQPVFLRESPMIYYWTAAVLSSLTDMFYIALKKYWRQVKKFSMFYTRNSYEINKMHIGITVTIQYVFLSWFVKFKAKTTQI